MTGLFDLLRSRRMLPLFLAQFCGAANDNAFKNALAILIVFRLGAEAGGDPGVLVTLAAGLFILPFFLFSATAGRLADRHEKGRMMKIVKAAEVAIAGLGCWALVAGSVPGMFGVLALLGVQAAFFGPLKYAVLPEYLAERELVDGNALIEAGTFLAILLGTIAGGALILTDGGAEAVAGVTFALAVAGFVASLFLPQGRPGDARVRVSPNPIADTFAVVRAIKDKRAVFLSVLGISWFWLVGATFLSQLPAFCRDTLGASQGVVTLMLTVFAVGIGVGSLSSGRMLKGEISARHVPFAALGLTLFSFDLYFASSGAMPSGDPVGPIEFLVRADGLRILFDLAAIAVCGGIYVVPLFAILQHESAEGERASAVAANNIVNAAFMVGSAVACAALLAFGLSVPQVFLVQAIANLAVAVYICALLPDALIKGALVWVLRRLYRVRVEGLEHFKSIEGGAVVVVNHISFLDAVLMAAFLPGKPTFAINTFIAKAWWVRPFLRLVETHAVDPTNPMSTRGLIQAVRDGRICVIFPEGRITVTGSLMKVYESPGTIADRAGAPIVPVRIDGAQYTPFSRLKGKIRRRWFPDIRIAVLAPRRFQVDEALRGRQRRRRIGAALYDVMSWMMYETAPRDRTLFEALLDAKRKAGAGAIALEDVNRRPLSYKRLVVGAHVLGREFARIAAPGEAVGLLLPNVNAAAAAFFALQLTGRVPAMLNFTAGANNVCSACATAKIATVITSRKFVAQAKLAALVQALEAQFRVVYLEDVAAGIGTLDKLRGLLAARFAKPAKRGAGDPAVILFTSGSEGTPKGVVLSHANILANCAQISARVAFGANDVVFNALPVFHSFGLTGGLLLPVLSGIRTFLYPSPLHYRIVPEMVYDTNATIMFGTDTFLSGYARVAAPYDFYSLRYVFAGAERVKDETRRVWMENFGVRILEGYGATETAPVIAVNTPMHARAGTVGRLLPGIEHRLEAVPGVEKGARLHVKGPNVMLGYLKADRPGELQPPEDGWYDTGDVVDIDADGFVRILGRAKRFAKIAGEMVSLGAVETAVAALWPDAAHAVVAVPDARKGEQLVLITTRAQAARAEISAYFRAQGLPELSVPRAIVEVETLPVLGSGKIDYTAVAEFAARLQTA
jgi:acyl-[acyl-carrier-protein]-phospholipid O-acyltransferase / long-chain-fatty-acid--[acyl-carrier-protein] ligase